VNELREVCFHPGFKNGISLISECLLFKLLVYSTLYLPASIVAGQDLQLASDLRVFIKEFPSSSNSQKPASTVHDCLA